MEDIGYLWTFQENVDELKQKLQYATLELEMTRKEANEEMKKSNQHIKQLLELLHTTCKERDDAISELMKLQLLFSLNNKPNLDLLLPISGPFSPDSPLLTNTSNYPKKASSGVTESISSSFSEHKYKHNPQIQSKKPQSHVINSRILCNKNEDNMKMEKIAKGRPLPKKGKLLEAVMEAGPLLHTLMVGGCLPMWRNQQPNPPVHIEVGYSGSGQKIINDEVGYGHISGGSLGMYQNTSPILDFGGASTGSCPMPGGLINSCFDFDSHISKRQRLV